MAPSRHFAATQQYSRFLSKADMSENESVQHHAFGAGARKSATELSVTDASVRSLRVMSKL